MRHLREKGGIRTIPPDFLTYFVPCAVRIPGHRAMSKILRADCMLQSAFAFYGADGAFYDIGQTAQYNTEEDKRADVFKKRHYNLVTVGRQ